MVLLIQFYIFSLSYLELKHISLDFVNTVLYLFTRLPRTETVSLGFANTILYLFTQLPRELKPISLGFANTILYLFTRLS